LSSHIILAKLFIEGVFVTTTVKEDLTFPKKNSFYVISRIFKNEFLHVLVILNITLVIFFSTPIFTPDSYYLGVDALMRTDNTLFNMELPKKINIGFIDPIRTFQPNLYYSMERFSKGELPLWNPYDGNGAPHLASMQSGIFSPFNLPVYLFGLKDGWLLSMYLKFLLVGLFTYGFLRKLKINHWIAIACSIAFMYNGYMLIWHIGPHGSSLLTLPAGMFFIEGAFQASSRRRQVLNLSGLALTITAGILGGHPETFFYGAVVLAAYILFRIWLAFAEFKQRLVMVLKYALFGILGVGMSALQLLPFIEYLRLNTSIRERVDQQIFQIFMVTSLFPKLHGYNDQSYNDPYGNIATELFLTHVGITFVFLTISAVFFLYKNKYFWFFGIITLFTFGYVYNIFPFSAWFRYLPLIQSAVAQRASFVISFGLCMISALVLNHLYQSRSSFRTLFWFIAGAVLFLGTALLGVAVHYEQTLTKTDTTTFQNYVPAQTWYVIIVFGLMLVAILLLTRTRWQWRVPGLILLICCSFAQGGFYLKDINGTSDVRYAWPVTDGIKAIQTIAGPDNIAFYNGIYIPPQSNLFYNLHDIRLFDAMYIPNYLALFNTISNPKDVISRPVIKITPRILKLFGVHYIVSRTSPPVMDETKMDPNSKKQPLPVLRTPIEQTFVAQYDNLVGIELFTATYGRLQANTCNIEFKLSEVTQPELALRTSKLPCTTIPEQQFVKVTFDPIPDSNGKTYRFSLVSPDSAPTNAIAVYTADLVFSGSSLRSGNNLLPSSLVFNQDYAGENTNPYLKVWQNDRFQIYQFKDAIPRYYSVGSTIKPKDENELSNLVFNQNFDPAVSAALSPESTVSPLSGSEYVPAKVLEDKPEYKKIQITRQTPGFLATSLTNYPGWKVIVNGKEVPVVRTNYAFIGAPLPAGNLEIEIKYDPLSFKLGLAGTFISLVLLLTLVVVTWRGNFLQRFKFGSAKAK
jgi:hypothetical protein